MTQDIAAEVLAALHRIAPEIEPALVDRAVALADQLDIDSMDFLQLLIALGARFGIDIPEADAPRLRTVDDIVAYLAARVGPPPPAG
jgi:acyl carrier protein